MYACSFDSNLSTTIHYYTCDCTGALLCFDSNLDYVAKQFEAVPHPPVRAMASP